MNAALTMASVSRGSIAVGGVSGGMAEANDDVELDDGPDENRVDGEEGRDEQVGCGSERAVSIFKDRRNAISYHSPAAHHRTS